MNKRPQSQLSSISEAKDLTGIPGYPFHVSSEDIIVYVKPVESHETNAEENRNRKDLTNPGQTTINYVAVGNDMTSAKSRDFGIDPGAETTHLAPVISMTSRVVDEIYRKIWALSPYVLQTESYDKLRKLTSELINLYELQGRLDKNPFVSARDRQLSLPFDDIYKELKDSTCIVTGGLGCVGSMLVKELLEFNVETIIVLDTNTNDKKQNFPAKVICLQCDIRSLQDLHGIFSRYQPHYVFHTAAQRDPGYAEAHVMETVSTNVLGTLNIINACEAVGTVRQMVFASTGKASRYFTKEIYAATKKIGEFLLDTYAKESTIKYSMVRFTHLLDNSLMNNELKDRSATCDYLSVHSPGKYVTAQNAKEAVYLILNALVSSVEKQCNVLLVRHLDWPVESLEVALYYIKQSERDIPVIFVGNPIGYSEKFFRGQVDWSRLGELNLLTNVYEGKNRRLNAGEDIIISRTCSVTKLLLEKVLCKIADSKSDREAKENLIEGLKELVMVSLKTVSKEETTDILRWGLDPEFLKLDNVKASDFKEIISLLVESLIGSEHDQEIEKSNLLIH